MIDKPSMDRTTALAAAWASIDGKLYEFEQERAGLVPRHSEAYTGHNEGYMAEAEELIRRINARGYDITPTPKSGNG